MKESNSGAGSTQSKNSFTDTSADKSFIDIETEDEIEEALYEAYQNSPQWEIDMEKQYQQHKDSADAEIEQLNNELINHPDYPQDYK